MEFIADQCNSGGRYFDPRGQFAPSYCEAAWLADFFGLGVWFL